MEKRKITVSDLEFLEHKLSEIVKDSVAETVSAIPITKDLHLTCTSSDDYFKVIDFVNNNPQATRNDIISLFIEIHREREKQQTDSTE